MDGKILNNRLGGQNTILAFHSFQTWTASTKYRCFYTIYQQQKVTSKNMKHTTTLTFSVYATRGNSQRIFVSLGHRSTLNTYTDSFFSLLHIFTVLFNRFGFPWQNKLHCIYGTRRSSLESSSFGKWKRRGDLGECMYYYKA